MSQVANLWSSAPTISRYLISFGFCLSWSAKNPDPSIVKDSANVARAVFLIMSPKQTDCSGFTKAE